MGTGKTFGYLGVKADDGSFTLKSVTGLIVPADALLGVGASEAQLLIPTVADIEAIVYAILAGFPGEGFILLESGDHLLMETDDELLLE